MTQLQPDAVVDEPLRRALGQIMARWLGVYVLAASIAAFPVLCGISPEVAPVWRSALPLFLVAFIGAHLVHPRRTRADGWQRAFRADPGSARMTTLVGAVGAMGLAAALAATFCPYEDLHHVVTMAWIWVPILAPLYAASIWVAADCAQRRLGRSADAADERFRAYWRSLSPR